VWVLRWGEALAPYLWLACVTIGLLWPLCLGRALYWGDILLYFEPMQRFGRQELMAGRLPLWNPYILCGQPFIGNPQMSVFYPITLVFSALPVWLSMSVSSLLHVYMCGAFMYVFLRRWTVHRLPALAGATTFMGSAYLVGKLQFPPMVQTAAYFPLLLAILDRNLDRPSAATRFALSIAVALTLLAAHTQVAYLTFGCGLLYAVVRLWRARPRSESPGGRSFSRGKRARMVILARQALPVIRRALPIVVASVFGLQLAAIYLLPAIQLMHDSARDQMSVGQANRFILDFPHLLGAVFPRITGHPATRDFWARGNAWEPAWFVGWAPLILGCYAVVSCRNENLVRFWYALGLVGIWLAVGSVGGLYWLAFYVVPGLSNFHDPARFLLWTTIASAVLTAVGFDALMIRNRLKTRSQAAVLYLAVLAPLVWFSRDWLPTTEPGNFNLKPAGLAEISRSAGEDRIAQPSNSLYWKRIVSDGYQDYGYGDRASVQRTVNTLLSNLDMRNGLESASGYEPVPIGSHLALEGLASLAQQRREPNAQVLMAILDAKVLLNPIFGGETVAQYHADNSLPSGTSVSRLIADDPVRRAWITRKILRVEGRTRIAAALTAPGFEPFQVTLVSGTSASNLGLSPIIAGSSSSRTELNVAWQHPIPTQVDLYPDAGRSPAFLVYSGTAVPGWKATVDSRSAPVICSDGTLLGVPIPPGRHKVVFAYSPDMFKIGTYLTLTAIAVMAGFVSAGYFMRNHGGGRS